MDGKCEKQGGQNPAFDSAGRMMSCGLETRQSGE